MRFIGEISALSAATIWAATSMLITYVAAKIGSLYANIGRMSLSLIFFIGVILIFRLPIELSARQWLFLALSALIGIVFGDTFLFKAFQQIGARLSMLIMASAPAIAALLAYVFLRETLSATGMLGILVTMTGIAFVVLERSDARSAASPVTLSGLMYAFFGALGQGGGVVCAKIAFSEGEINGFVAAFIRLGISTLCMLPILFLHRQQPNPLPIFRKQKMVAAALLGSAFFGAFLGITLSLFAVKYAAAGVASILMATSPVLMLPMVKFAYHEQLSWKAISGAMLAVGGVALLFL